MRWTAWGVVLGAAVLGLSVSQAEAWTGPVELRMDNLKTPLGIGVLALRFSWQLQDPARGARQTAYEVTVASRAKLKPEEDAIRHASAIWVNNPDSASMIGDHAKEHHFMYRTTVKLTKPVWRATLYATGEDTVAGWVNGTNVIIPSPYPARKIMSWRRYAQGDATLLLAPGDNVIGVEVIHYLQDPSATGTNDVLPPMSATLVVEYTDGTTAAFGSGPQWKTALYADAGWMQPDVDLSMWKNAVVWKQAPDFNGYPLGNPRIPDSVKETLMR